MKKTSLLIIFAIIPIVGLVNSCKKEDSCPERTDIGQLFWSNETEKWFPSKYLNKPANLEFVSENGDIAKFQLDYSEVLEGDFEYFDMECDNGEGSTRVRWADRRYSGRFLTPDSLAIVLGIGVWNEKLILNEVIEADFYEWVSITVYRLNDGTADDIGRIRIITDLRNSEIDEIDLTPENYEKLENFGFMGNIYPELYQDGKPDFPNANIYFQKGKGLVGYIDENGMKWKIKE